MIEWEVRVDKVARSRWWYVTVIQFGKDKYSRDKRSKRDAFKLAARASKWFGTGGFTYVHTSYKFEPVV